MNWRLAKFPPRFFLVASCAFPPSSSLPYDIFARISHGSMEDLPCDVRRTVLDTIRFSFAVIYDYCHRFSVVASRRFASFGIVGFAIKIAPLYKKYTQIKTLEIAKSRIHPNNTNPHPATTITNRHDIKQTGIMS